MNSRVVVALLLAACPLGAQAVVRGAITNDDGRRLPGVELFVAELGKVARTDSSGEYKLVVPAGNYWLNVRAMGYFTTGDSIEPERGVDLIHDFTLSSFGIRLDTVSVTAPREYISFALRDFEMRRKEGMGHYLAEAELRRADNRQFADVLRKVPGLLVTPGKGLSYYAASLRGTPGGALAKTANGPTQSACYVTVYLDGVTLSDGNLTNFDTRTIAGVEFYSGHAASPVQFRHNECGLLMLWTRER